MAVACEPEVRAGAPGTGLANGSGQGGRLGWAARTGCAVMLAFVAAAGACDGGAEAVKHDAGQDVAADMAATPDTATPDTATPDVATPDKPAKGLGDSCASSTECGSGQCVEGVCCNEGCNRACFTCVNPGTEGTCLPAFQGTDPGDRCPTEAATTCGTTGVCDGTGACARFSGNAGVVCAAEACLGFMRTTTGTCDSAGGCSGATTLPCTPFQCAPDGKTCRTTCTSDADCVAPNSCVAGSCGKKPIGATCGNNDECNSTFCAQGRCCGTVCTGTCRSCAVAGSEGTCRNVPDGQDLHGHCADETAATCGLDGMCNGMGACRKYAVSTVCGMDSCSAGAERVAGRCDAAGTCAPGMLRSCTPYVCGTTNCKTSCATAADCVAGYGCVGNVCVQQENGTPCTSAGMCKSGYCEQGVCCNDGCAATCKACNLTGSVGTCSPIPAGMAPTPATQCTDMAATNPCGTDGRCNGAGACRNYAAGTACGAASCTGSTLSSPRTCDGAGVCRAATTSPCTPYTCGTNACRTTCTATTQCTTGNTCVNSSCGKIPIGGACPSGMNSDCDSGFCVNNVCCNTACTGTCMSCSLAASVGTCSPIAPGAPPLVAAQCPAAAASTCGNDGTCDGAGACRKHVSGTQCAAPMCSSATIALSARTCNGAGVCGAATSSPCGRYTCDTTAGACRTSCTTAATDCVAPNICNANICTLKPTGVACTTAGECASNFCAQGFCCNQACDTACKSCAITGSLGTCSNVANGTAPSPATQCPATVATSCGLDGMCNGAGACRFWASGTQCVAGTCVGSTLTPARTCDGAGICRSVTSALCDPYQCGSATACKTTCTSTATDCVSPNSCVSMSCGKLPNGAACTAPAMCNSGFCAQGVCCSTACNTGICSSCALAGSLGVCSSVPAGQDPLNQCTDNLAATCGTDGSCNGSGACRMYGAGTQCVAATCTGSTLTSARTCNGTGTCQAATTSSCMAYACGTGACKTTCTTTADCSGPPYTCLGMTCTNATNLTVRLKAANMAASTVWITQTFQITNNGTTAIPLSDLVVRYWYTYDTTPIVPQTGACDYSFLPGNCTNIIYNGATPAPFTAVSPARTNADYYYQFGFAAAAGSLAASGGTTGDIGVRFSKNNFTNFTQANDYSYNNSAAFAVTTNVTVYRAGVLVYGTEPP